MARVTGIGGFFFRAQDPDALNRWYGEHFAIVMLESEDLRRPGLVSGSRRDRLLRLRAGLGLLRLARAVVGDQPARRRPLRRDRRAPARGGHRRRAARRGLSQRSLRRAAGPRGQPRPAVGAQRRVGRARSGPAARRRLARLDEQRLRADADRAVQVVQRRGRQAEARARTTTSARRGRSTRPPARARRWIVSSVLTNSQSSIGRIQLRPLAKSAAAATRASGDGASPGDELAAQADPGRDRARAELAADVADLARVGIEQLAIATRRTAAAARRSAGGGSGAGAAPRGDAAASGRSRAPHAHRAREARAAVRRRRASRRRPESAGRAAPATTRPRPARAARRRGSRSSAA